MIENIKKDIYSKKIVIIIVFIIFFIGLLFGSLYITILNNDNKKEILDSVSNYITSYKTITFSSKLEIFRSSLINNFIYFIIMWSLGLSIIGIPVILIMIFFKSFVFGFSIGGLFACYKTKGLLLILVYIIPNLILLILNLLLGIYSINLSIKLLTNALTKKTLNFGSFMGKYFFLLMIIILIIILSSLVEAFISPIFYKMLNSMI